MSSVSGRIVAVLLVALAGFAAVLPGRLHDVHALGAPLRVAVLQGNVPQDQKWLPGMREPTLERYLALTRRHPDADLVVWPETAVPGSRPRVDGYLSDLDAELRRSATAALVGLPERDLASRRIYNSVELLGIARGHYRKQHLVPFGEYLPLDGLLRPITEVLGIRVASFSPGPMTQPPLRLGQVGLGVFVCYEIAFGNEVIRRLPEAALLVTVSNDAWFGDSLGPQQHLQMARARAIETGRYLVRATNTGLSAVVDPEGREILRLPAFQVADGAVSVQPMRGATVYVRGGDLPALGLALMLVGLAAWGARRRRGSGTQSGT